MAGKLLNEKLHNLHSLSNDQVTKHGMIGYAECIKEKRKRNSVLIVKPEAHQFEMHLDK
jgi:hypothetical protein